MAKTEDGREMYELVCKEKFDFLIEKQDEVLGLLRGRNGTPGLVEEVRSIKKLHKLIIGVVGFVVSVIVVQLFVWLRQNI